MNPQNVEAFVKLSVLVALMFVNGTNFRDVLSEFNMLRHFGYISVLHLALMFVGGFIQLGSFFLLVLFLLGEWP